MSWLWLSSSESRGGARLVPLRPLWPPEPPWGREYEGGRGGGRRGRGGEMEEEEGGGDQGSSLSLREKTRCSNAQIHRPKARRPRSQPHLRVFIIIEWPTAAIFGKHSFWQTLFSWSIFMDQPMIVSTSQAGLWIIYDCRAWKIKCHLCYYAIDWFPCF